VEGRKPAPAGATTDGERPVRAEPNRGEDTGEFGTGADANTADERCQERKRRCE